MPAYTGHPKAKQQLMLKSKAFYPAWSTHHRHVKKEHLLTTAGFSTQRHTYLGHRRSTAVLPLHGSIRLFKTPYRLTP